MVKRDEGGRFAKGSSGNPAGKPRGARNRTTLAAQRLLEGEAKRLTRKAIELALAGDSTALRLCLDRVIPPRRSPVVQISIPALRSTRDAVEASARVVQAAADGEITLADAEALGRLLELNRRLIETEELARRISDLENSASNEGKGRKW